MSGGRQAVIGRASPAVPVRSAAVAVRHRDARASFLAAAAIGSAYLLVIGLLLTRRPATALEAQLAAAISGPVDHGGTVVTAWSDAVAAAQLAWIGLILDPGRTAVLIDIARATALLLVLATALLIFPIARRLELAPALAATATAGAAVLGGLVLLYGGLNPGTLAVVWLSLAALLALAAARYLRWAALVATGVAVLCAPLAAVGVLVFGAHLVAVSAAAPSASVRTRRMISAALASGAAAVAVLASGDRLLAPASGGDLALPSAVPLIAGSAVIIGLAWRRLDWLRPVCTAVAAMLACGLLPGAGLAIAASLAAPVLALLGIALLDTVRGAAPGRPLVAVVIAIGLLAASSTFGFPLGWRAAPAASVSGWIKGELDPARIVLADELTRAQLVRDGVPATRLRPLEAAPASPGAVVVLVDRPGQRAPELGAQSQPLARFADGPGHADAEVRLLEPGSAGAQQAERGDRTRFGTALAANASVSWSPAAAAALRAGRVDPRLMAVLAGLATAHRITVGDLPAAPGEPPDAPRRTAVITAFDGASTTEPATVAILRQWLGRQLPPFAPVVTERAGEPLRVGFPSPTQLGLLPG